MRAAAFLVLLFLLAGCLSPGPRAATGDAASATAAPDDGGRTSRGGGQDDGDADEADAGPQPIVLGEANGGLTTPGRYDFAVNVPAGGATDVQWDLTVWPGGAGLDAIEGAGCPHDPLAIQQSSAVGSHTTTFGDCPSLDAGNRTFTVVLQQPVQSFAARVLGVPAAPAAAAGPASNATET